MARLTIVYGDEEYFDTRAHVAFSNGSVCYYSGDYINYDADVYFMSIPWNDSSTATGVVYWGTSIGDTSYPLADVYEGDVQFRSSTEEITYTGSNRNIYLTFVEEEPEPETYTLTVHFPDSIGGVGFTNGDYVSRSRILFFELSYGTLTYDSSLVFDPYDTDFRSGKANTGSLYWGRSSGATTWKIGDYEDGIYIYGTQGSVSERTVDFLGDRDIYLTFEEAEIYDHSITFHENPVSTGDVISNMPANVSYQSTDYYETLGIPANVPYPSDRSYRFVEWHDNQTGRSYSPGSNVYDIHGNVDLYAVWEQKTTHRLYFNGNPVHYGDQIRNVPTTQSVSNYQSYAVITIPSNEPYQSDDEYRFRFWHTDPNATSSIGSYGPGDTITVYDSQTLYAIWEVPTEYTLAFDGNPKVSGDQIRNVPLSITDSDYASSHTFTIPDNVPYTTSGAYEFEAWNANESGTGVSYSPGGRITLSRAGNPTTKTLYAEWKDTIIPISFHGNGGVWGTSQSVKTVNEKTGDPIYFSVYSAGLTRKGYRLLGWTYIEGSDIAIWDTSGSTTVSVSRPDYYAVWEKITIEKFYWDGNTGSTDATLFASGQIVKNGLTASRWNAFREKIKELSDALDIPYSYSSVSANSTITAADFNNSRNGINNLTAHGAIPSAKAKGDVIQASLYNGSTSLKNGLNTAIDNYNNTN